MLRFAGLVLLFFVFWILMLAAYYMAAVVIPFPAWFDTVAGFGTMIASAYLLYRGAQTRARIEDQVDRRNPPPPGYYQRREGESTRREEID